MRKAAAHWGLSTHKHPTWHLEAQLLALQALKSQFGWNLNVRASYKIPSQATQALVSAYIPCNEVALLPFSLHCAQSNGPTGL